MTGSEDSGSPTDRLLEPIDAPSGQLVTFETDELTAHCPFEFGGPDYYDLVLRYETDGQTIEAKSLKKYLEAFRDEETTAESLARGIYEDVLGSIDPQRAYLRLEQARRGGIEETVEEGDDGLRR